MLESLPESLSTLKRLKKCTVEGCKKLKLPNWFADKFPKSMAQGKAMVMDGIALGAKKAKVVLNVAAPVVEGALALVVGAEKAQQVKEKTKEKLDVVLNVASPVVNKGIEQGAKIGKGMLSAGSKAGSFMASSALSFGSSLFSKDKKSPTKDAVNDDDDTWGFPEKTA